MSVVLIVAASLGSSCAGMLNSSPESAGPAAGAPPSVDARNAAVKPARRLVRVGDPFPAFTWSDQNGAPVSTAEVTTGGDALLVFHPGDDSPAARPAYEFARRRREQLSSYSTEILLVSPDPVERNAQTAAAESLRVGVLHDPAAWGARAFGVDVGPAGPAGVTSVLLGREGRVLAVQPGLMDVADIITALKVRPEGERRGNFFEGRP
jgi:peroxiredoxin